MQKVPIAHTSTIFPLYDPYGVQLSMIPQNLKSMEILPLLF